MKGKGLYSKWSNEPVYLNEIDQLIERGLNNEEIAKELGIHKKHVERILNDIDKNY